MKYNLLFSLLILVILSACKGKDKNELVIYPEYCQGCIIRNFSKIKTDKVAGDFDIYFDTTDAFLLNNARENGFTFHHIKNEDIAEKFGDYANLLVISSTGKVHELKTNETLTKGVHFN